MNEIFASNEFSDLFAPEGVQDAETVITPKECWKILLVDDEPDVHSVLKLGLQEMEVDGATMQIFDAYSAKEARSILTEHPDIALILLDVVMEGELSGLELVKFIRQRLINRMVQILLLTGQPGYAPQREVVSDYEINGYHLKSELTATKIFAWVCTALRGFRLLNELECQRQQIERQTEKLRLAASVFTYAREGIMITDEAGTIIEVNYAFTLITGYAQEDVIGRNPRLLSSGHQTKVFYAAMWNALIQKGHWYGEIWNRRKTGEVYAEMLNISSIYDSQGNIQNYLALFSDITTIKEHEKSLEKIAHYDALTSLPNRVLLADRMRQAMINIRRHGQSMVVAYLDLDGFKEINDNHGHEAGDRVLVTVSSRMQQCLREADTLARLGGDEFIIVMLDLIDLKTSEPLLTRLLQVIAQPVLFGNIALQVSASVGVTVYPQMDEIDADQLLRQADHAMYQAKLTGKNRFTFYDAKQDSDIRVFHGSKERIEQALHQREFVIYYQPKVNMRHGIVLGAEALIRWQHPEKGLLSPTEFLPMIENHPLIADIGEWVVETVLTQIEQWKSQGLDIPVSVNVSARELQHGDFEQRLQQQLLQHPKIKPSQLELEILETSALEDISRVTQIIETCRTHGIMSALDDFGTGYSSLTYLKRLPVSLIKIDQSFVRDMLHDIDSLSILDGMLNLAHSLDREVIAEGVETIEHGLLLLKLGCERAQGYGIARPMPPDQLSIWIGEWCPDPRWQVQPKLNRDEILLLFVTVEHFGLIKHVETILQQDIKVPTPLMSTRYFDRWVECERLNFSQKHQPLDTIVSLHSQIMMLVSELFEFHKQVGKQDASFRLEELHGLCNNFLEHIKSVSIHC